MQLDIVSMHSKLPAWVQTARQEYLDRIPPKYWQINFKNLAITKTEADLYKAIPTQSLIITLDSRGSIWSTLELKQQFEKWQHISNRIAFIIGGPDGLSKDFLNHSHQVWSLSALTFPHAIVQILLLEQLYRIYSMLNNHPYHRS